MVDIYRACAAPTDEGAADPRSHSSTSCHTTGGCQKPHEGEQMDRFRTLLMAFLAVLATGCDQIGEQATKAVEQRVQKETEKLVNKAIGSVEKTLDPAGAGLLKEENKPKVVAEGSLQVAGVAVTGLTITESPSRAAAVYCTFEKGMNSALEARFLSKAGAEIGRAQQRVSAKPGSGQFVEFEIDPRTSVQEILTVSIRKP